MRAFLIPALLFLTSFGCASPSTPPTTTTRVLSARENVRVLVLDARWLTEGSTLEIDLFSVVDALARAPVETQRPPAPPLEACAEDVACVRSLGRDAGTTHVVLVELAGLGQTMVVRMRLVEARPEGSDVVRQRVIEDATVERVEETLAQMASELVAPLVPVREVRRAWYERPYVYVIGAGIVAGAVGTGIGVRRYREGLPDIVIVPP